MADIEMHANLGLLNSYMGTQTQANVYVNTPLVIAFDRMCIVGAVNDGIWSGRQVLCILWDRRDWRAVEQHCSVPGGGWWIQSAACRAHDGLWHSALWSAYLVHWERPSRYYMSSFSVNFSVSHLTCKVPFNHSSQSHLLRISIIEKPCLKVVVNICHCFLFSKEEYFDPLTHFVHW